MEDKEQRMKVLKYSVLLIGIAFFMSSWYATQMIAKEYFYLPELSTIKVFGFDINLCLKILDYHIYFPFMYQLWEYNMLHTNDSAALSWGLTRYSYYIWGAMIFCVFPIYYMSKKFQTLSSHGTGRWANKEEIVKAGFASRKNGFVCGLNHNDGSFLLHDGEEHVLLCAPTGSGKGVGVIIPTSIVWRESIFIFDPKSEIWDATSWWRKKHHNQRVIKFAPLNTDGSSAHWNPFAEIDFQGLNEIDDASTIAQIMTDPGEGNQDPFWKDSAAAIVTAIILHLMYQFHNENRSIPCPADLISFISAPDTDKMHLFAEMKIYPHISVEDFLEIKDKNGVEHRNILYRVCGDYITNAKPYARALSRLGIRLEDEFKRQSEEGRPSDVVRAIQSALLRLRNEHPDKYSQISWEPPDIAAANGQKEIIKKINEHNLQNPWYMLLVHPIVAQGAASIVNSESGGTSSSILSSAQTPLSLYRNNVVKQNTNYSDFTLKDLKNPDRAASLYFIVAANDVKKIAPLTRLFTVLMFSKLTKKMIVADKKKPRKLLLLLDEFFALKKMPAIEDNLNICRGAGIRVCVVVQSTKQIDMLYTKDNSIIAGCPLQIYYKAADIETAKNISDLLGSQTIKLSSISTTGEILKSTSSTSEQGRKLLEPDEVTRLPDNKVIIIPFGHRPLLEDKVFYYNMPYFDNKVRNVRNPRIKDEKDHVKALLLSDTGTEIKNFEQLFAVTALEREQLEKDQKAVALAKQKAYEKFKALSEKNIELQEKQGIREEDNSDEDAAPFTAQPAEPAPPPAQSEAPAGEASGGGEPYAGDRQKDARAGNTDKVTSSPAQAETEMHSDVSENQSEKPAYTPSGLSKLDQKKNLAITEMLKKQAADKTRKEA